MKKNVGSIDRAARGLGAIALIVCAFLAPVLLEVRAVMGVMGAYWVFTAFAGTCFGYRLMGLSTCPAERR
jgi:hypothetical protein